MDNELRDVRAALSLRAWPERFVVCRLNPREPWPPFMLEACPVFLARTQEELSAIVPVHAAPQDGAERTVHAAFAVPGVMPFNLVGVLHALTGPLAAAQVPVLAVSTHDTDVLLVREAQVDRAIHAWRGAGICVEESCL